MDDQLHSDPLGGSAPPVTRDRGRSFRSGVLAAGAAVGMTLAGLGVANAQTDNTTPTTPTTEAPANGAAPADRPHPGKDCEGPGRVFSGSFRHGLATAASTIGVTEEELRTALHSGQSLAQVAQSKGVAPQKVIDAMVAEAKTKLADAVKSGDLTQAQADERSTKLSERITEMVNHTGGPGPGPRGMHRGGARPGATEEGSSVQIGSDPTVTEL